MAERTRERDIVGSIRKKIKALFPDAYIVKIHGDAYQVGGVPDLLICISGLFIALEVKRPGQHPTDLQQYTLREIRQAGGIAACVDSVEVAVNVLNQAIGRV